MGRDIGLKSDMIPGQQALSPKLGFRAPDTPHPPVYTEVSEHKIKEEITGQYSHGFVPQRWFNQIGGGRSQGGEGSVVRRFSFRIGSSYRKRRGY